MCECVLPEKVSVASSLMISISGRFRRPFGILCHRLIATEATAIQPSEIFRHVAAGDIENALKLCDGFATAVKLSPTEFLAKQCSERSYLIYRLSTESRAAALEIAQSGDAFPSGVRASELLAREDLWPTDVSEQYERAVNSIRLSRTALELGSPHPARDYQIIGKSVVYKLLFGRTACLLQTFMSRELQETKKPYDWAIANHRTAARLFDEHLAPQGPIGPLEKPEDLTHNIDAFRDWSDSRVKAVNQHLRLIVHLTSDVARHVLPRDEGQALLSAASNILSEEMNDGTEKHYAAGVIRSTLRAI